MVKVVVLQPFSESYCSSRFIVIAHQQQQFMEAAKSSL